MRGRTKVVLAFAFVTILFFAYASAIIYYEKHEKESEVDSPDLNVAIIDSDFTLAYSANRVSAIKMALDEVNVGKNVKVKVKLYDDAGEYTKGIAIAKKLLDDPFTDVVCSMQDNASQKMEMYEYELKGKPFISLRDSSEKNFEKKYDYFACLAYPARKCGVDMARAMFALKSKRVALCHSNTEFERSEISGIQSEITLAQAIGRGIDVVDTEIGPHDSIRYDAFVEKCKMLNVDTIAMSFESYRDTIWLCQKLRKDLPNVKIIVDYYVFNTTTVMNYGGTIDGVYVVPSFPIKNNKETLEMEKKIKKYTLDILYGKKDDGNKWLDEKDYVEAASEVENADQQGIEALLRELNESSESHEPIKEVESSYTVKDIDMRDSILYYDAIKVFSEICKDGKVTGKKFMDSLRKKHKITGGELKLNPDGSNNIDANVLYRLKMPKWEYVSDLNSDLVLEGVW